MKQKPINEKAAAKQAERAGLAGILTYNDLIPEIMSVFKSEFFNWKEHQTIFTLIGTIFQEKNSVDQTLLILKLDQLGLKEVNGLDMQEYIKTLYSFSVNKDSVLDFFREVYKMHICRKSYAALGQAQTYINSNLEKPLSEILADVQKITVDSVTANIEEKVKIVSIYEDLPNFLESRASKKESSYIKTGFKIFDDLYGGVLKKGVYVFAAPAKVGKSTFLNYLAYQAAGIRENKLKVLILDTELESEFAESRALSALTGINEFEFLEGDFARNSEFAAKTKQALANIPEYIKPRIKHAYVANSMIDEVLSIARRWYVTEVKKDENALIIYDYIKLAGGESVLDSHWKEYQEIGEKTDKLKKFVSTLENAALATSVQTNAQGQIGMSRQIIWFANNIYILQRKTLEEIQEDGKDNGTHRLVQVEVRNQGRYGKGSHNSFSWKTEDGRTNYLEDWINFDFSNFKVVEVNTRKDVFSQKASQLKAEKGYEEA